MLLSEKVRVEIFIPDLPDSSYSRLLMQLETELSYTFGGCTVISADGKFRSGAGLILPDKVNILFTDASFDLKRDRLIVGQYVDRVRAAIETALANEESILVAIYPVLHAQTE